MSMARETAGPLGRATVDLNKHRHVGAPPVQIARQGPLGMQSAMSLDELWNSDVIMAANAEVGLPAHHLLTIARAVAAHYGIAGHAANTAPSPWRVDRGSRRSTWVAVRKVGPGLVQYLGADGSAKGSPSFFRSAEAAERAIARMVGD